ncbi:MAG: hypothetical protein IKM89_07000 [Bacteroidales bacterium]|nr:hypothetical protein [Bacteroidales bacterium]
MQEKASSRARSWDYYEGQWDGGTHNPYFMNPDYYAKETSEQIQAAITAFLGL